MTNEIADKGRQAKAGTITEKAPVLSSVDRAALVKSLVEAEERIEAGDFVAYDPRTFEDRHQRS